MTSPEPLLADLQRRADLWDAHTPRTKTWVHAQASDIWVRYNAWENYHGSLLKMSHEHTPVWYPAYEALPSLQGLIAACAERVGAVDLGGIFLTRLGPGKRILRHADSGWHAETYSLKFAYQVQGDADQAFCFDGHALSALPGELYLFDNLQPHWVYNMSDKPRITLLMTAKPPQDGR